METLSFRDLERIGTPVCRNGGGAGLRLTLAVTGFGKLSRHCEEQSDEAISKYLIQGYEIAALRSQ
jgi:hypothetical protein